MVTDSLLSVTSEILRETFFFRLFFLFFTLIKTFISPFLSWTLLSKYSAGIGNCMQLVSFEKAEKRRKNLFQKRRLSYMQKAQYRNGVIITVARNKECSFYQCKISIMKKSTNINKIITKTIKSTLSMKLSFDELWFLIARQTNVHIWNYREKGRNLKLIWRELHFRKCKTYTVVSYTT